MSLTYLPNSADTARANGIVAGTKLVGDFGFGATVIEITAVAESHVLAKIISDYRTNWPVGETGWELHKNRSWEVLA